jgi:signal peptidase I
LSLRRILFGASPRRTIVRVGTLVVVSFVTFTWVLIPIHTHGISMLPTYASDRLNLVNRLAYMANPPARGDVVAVRLAGGRAFYVKRIVGLPGERVAIVGGYVHVDGVPMEEPYVVHRRRWEMREITLGPREYFVVGDNRGMNAADHDFGGVDRDRIAGRILF